jgi:TolB protein
MVRIIVGLAFGIWTAVLILMAVTLEIVPALASDEGQVAFESDRDGNWEIYTLDLRTSIAYNLTHTPAADHSPSWSPDGGQIAFHSNRSSDTDIYVMSFSGRDVLRITDSGRDWRPRWSPDGKRIMFIRDFDEIYMMNADGSEAQYITNGFGPEWSPDGKQLVFYLNQANSLKTDIYISDADGHHEQNLTRSSTHDWGPTWLPDGRSIAYVSSSDGNSRIYVLDTVCALAGDAGCAHLLDDGGVIHETPHWSPDGRQVAFNSIYQWQSQLYFMDADGTHLRRLITVSGNDQQPAWSP